VYDARLLSWPGRIVRFGKRTPYYSTTTYVPSGNSYETFGASDVFKVPFFCCRGGHVAANAGIGNIVYYNAGINIGIDSAPVYDDNMVLISTSSYYVPSFVFVNLHANAGVHVMAPYAKRAGSVPADNLTLWDSSHGNAFISAEIFNR
jgi:hypothetical protein